MQELLDHPVMQGGLAPFLVAALTAVLLRQFRLSGLAVIAGFAVTVYLVTGFAIEPLTASRKIVWLGGAAALLAVPLNLLHQPRWRTVIAVLAAAAAVWMALRILEQRAAADAVGSALYTGWLAYGMDGLRRSAVRAGSAGMALGLGTGAAALLGASAVLGQYGLALGAAAAAYLLIVFVGNRELPCGRLFTLPLALIAGLVGCLAVLTAQLPWYALPFLAVIPLAGAVPLPGRLSLRAQTLAVSMAALLCAAAAVYLSWRINGAPPL